MRLLVPWIGVGGLWWSSFALLRSRALLPPDEAFLGGGLIALFEILTVSTVLGAAGALTPRPALLFAAMIAAAQFFAASLEEPAKFKADSASGWPWPLRAGAAFAGAAVVARMALAAAAPPDSWDGLTYHLPILWRWVQQGGFDLAGWAGPQRWFPWNGELLPAWLAVMGEGSLAPAKLAQFLALPLLAGAGAVLGRCVAGKAWSAACALAFAAVPIAVIHAGVPYVDGLHAAFWLSAAAFAVAWDFSNDPRHLLLAALAFGLALGTKSTIYFLAPLGLLISAPLAAHPERRGAFARLLGPCVVLVAAAGGYCYVRNWALMGSPIYPYALKVAGITIFKGPSEPGQLLVSVERWFVSSRWGWLAYPFRETMRGELGYTTENGFGPLFAAGWLALPWAGFLAWRRRERSALSFFALVPATALFFFTLHPTREPRYVIFLAGVPIVALAYVLRDLRDGFRVAALVLWSTGVSWGALGVLDYVSREPGQARSWSELLRRGRIDPLAYYRAQYGSLGAAWEFLDARLKARDVVVVNYGELALPWAGVPPRAKVFVVGHAPNDMPESLWATTPEEWLFLLDRLGARYFALWTPAWYPDVGLWERAAVAGHPGRFESLGSWDSSGFGRVELFEIKR